MRRNPMLLLATNVMLSVLGCGSPSVPGSPGVPEPIKVLENPTTGERARFYQEISFKQPAGYSEAKHLDQWTSAQAKAGFSREVVDDRENLAELRKKNLEVAKP